MPKRLTPEGIEAELSEELSPERFDKAQQRIDQYCSEEGLRRLRKMVPEAVQQFERPLRVSHHGHGEKEGQSER